MHAHPGRDRPIGVFDSGLGGLSVVRELQAWLPGEDVLYAADSAHCPYGDRPPEAIRARSRALAAALRERGAKALVVACNTACAVALADLRALHPDLPIVGLVPAVKPAAAVSRRRKIAVLATTRTAGGPGLAALLREHATGVEAILLPAPGLAECVERGETAGEAVETILCPLLAPLRGGGVDAVVLGCTHYPFLRPTIARLLGPEVTLVDSGEAIARRTRAVLDQRGLARAQGTTGSLSLLTTGDPAAVAAVAARLLGRPVPVDRLPV